MADLMKAMQGAKMKHAMPPAQENEQPGEGENEATEQVDLPYLMKMEQETIEDYSKFLESVQDPEEQKIISAILDDEKQHLEQLQGISGQGQPQEAAQPEAQDQTQQQ